MVEDQVFIAVVVEIGGDQPSALVRLEEIAAGLLGRDRLKTAAEIPQH